jgi:hypothetical protein
MNIQKIVVASKIKIGWGTILFTLNPLNFHNKNMFLMNLEVFLFVKVQLYCDGLGKFSK